MSPLIRDGDTITLASLAGRSPRLGDVLAVISPANSQQVVLRVVATRGGCDLLKGNAAYQPDGWVDPQGVPSPLRVIKIPYGWGLRHSYLKILKKIFSVKFIGALKSGAHY